MTKAFDFFERILTILGGFTLICMVLLTCSDIIMRCLSLSVRGSYELLGFLGAVTTAFALAYTQKSKGHVTVGLFVNIFPKSVQQVFSVFNNLISALLFIFISHQLFVFGYSLCEAGELTETLRIAYYPFIYAVAAGCIGLAALLCLDLVKSLTLLKGIER